LNGDILRKYGLQTSGRYATAEDNTLLGLVYLVYAWNASQLKNKYGSFFTYCKALLYGDDMIVAVKDEVIDDFNNSTYQSFCKEKYNMDFTTASKGSSMEKFLTFDQISFLKRKFKYYKETERIVSPLDLNSLYKSLEWRIPSQSVSTSKQDHDTINSFLIESYLYFRSDHEYEMMRKNLISEFGKIHPNHVEPFHTVDSVREILELT
jgi:hypothetical protein